MKKSRSHSILDELKERFQDKLNNALIDARLVETRKGVDFVYDLFDTDECTITYRHKVCVWVEEEVFICRSAMLKKGDIEDFLNTFTNELPFPNYDFFIKHFVFGRYSYTLSLLTNIFSPEGSSKILGEHLDGLNHP